MNSHSIQDQQLNTLITTAQMQACAHGLQITLGIGGPVPEYPGQVSAEVCDIVNELFACAHDYCKQHGFPGYEIYVIPILPQRSGKGRPGLAVEVTHPVARDFGFRALLAGLQAQPPVGCYATAKQLVQRFRRAGYTLTLRPFLRRAAHSKPHQGAQALTMQLFLD